MECLKIHEEVRLIDGYLRSVAYDLPRSEFFFLPKSLSVFLKKNDKKPLVLFKGNDFFIDFKEFLINNEIVFIEDGSLMKNFSKLNIEWKSPYLITNCIIDILDFDFNLFRKQLEIIETLNIKHVHFNLKKNINKKNLKFLIEELNSSCLQSIDFLITKSTEKHVIDLLNICVDYTRVRKIYIPDDLVINFKTDKVNYLSLIYYNYSTESASTIYNFTVNISFFTEAHFYNSYFNRKLYITADGLLKNSPECIDEFGNILNLNSPKKLTDIILSNKFSKYSKANKDKCDVCKDCEFRYMCNDNRLPKQRNNNEWFYESECSYNPYIAKWSNENGYLSLQKCGIETNKNGFKIDKRKIDTINKNLWDND